MNSKLTGHYRENAYCFIINPAADGGSAGRKWPYLLAALNSAGIEFQHYISERRGHGTELARHARQAGYRRFVVVGGDGTANEVLNGIYCKSPEKNNELSLGIVPWGTGNDLAHYYSWYPEPEQCLARLQSGTCVLHDIGKVSYRDFRGDVRTHFFLNCAGTGFDSYLLEKMENTRGSRYRYFLYVIRCLRHFRASKLDLKIGEEPLDFPALMLDICLGRYAGAGMQFAPDARADDGLFDVLLIKDLTVTQLFVSLAYLYNGRIYQHPKVEHWLAERVVVASDREQSFHCDGELVGQLPVEVEILPQTLRLMTTRQKV